MSFQQGQALISVVSSELWADQGLLGMGLSVLGVMVIIIVVLLRQLVLLSNRKRAVARVPIRYEDKNR
jgi:hypothetical protein